MERRIVKRLKIQGVTCGNSIMPSPIFRVNKKVQSHKSGSSFYCENCLADTKVDCICQKIVGYDARTGFPIIDDKETKDAREWALFWE